MPTGWVLINTEIGSEADVIKDLEKIKEVQEVHSTYGVYDIVARIEGDTMEKLKEIVTNRVRRLNSVKSTLTMIAVEGADTTNNSRALKGTAMLAGVEVNTIAAKKGKKKAPAKKHKGLQLVRSDPATAR